MKIKATVFALFAAAGLVISGSASAEGLFKSCKEDLTTYCAEVTPGDGRTLACLYAHTASLSDACYEATDGIGRILEGFFDKLHDVNAMCAEDMRTHCAGVQVGGGYTFRCLRENRDKLSQACADELPAVSAPSGS